MMKVFVFRKTLKRLVSLTAGLVVVTLLTYGVIGYDHDISIFDFIQTKADRSNARQVTKAIAPEQTLSAISSDFFTEYRIERDKIRSERSEILREAMKNSKTDDARQQAQDAILKMMLEKQREVEMENLIRARGFLDSLVFIRDNSVSVVVKSALLSKEEVIQVADIISRISGVNAEDITISAKP